MKTQTLLAALTVLSLPALPARADSPSEELHEVMEQSAETAPRMKMTGDVDKDFAKMMAQHHRSGIKMAQIQAENGKDPELKQLAKKIVSSQKEELEVLEKHAGSTHR